MWQQQPRPTTDHVAEDAEAGPQAMWRRPPRPSRKRSERLGPQAKRGGHTEPSLTTKSKDLENKAPAEIRGGLFYYPDLPVSVMQLFRGILLADPQTPDGSPRSRSNTSFPRTGSGTQYFSRQPSFHKLDQSPYCLLAEKFSPPVYYCEHGLCPSANKFQVTETISLSRSGSLRRVRRPENSSPAHAPYARRA